MQQKIIFQFNSLGIYVGTAKCQISPLEPGKFLMPANSTEVQPPDYDGEVESPVWDGKAWQVIKKIPKAEVQWANIRDIRNQMIDKTDKLMCLDSPLDEKSIEALKIYREALRDIPQTFDSPEKVKWPILPTLSKKVKNV